MLGRALQAYLESGVVDPSMDFDAAARKRGGYLYARYLALTVNTPVRSVLKSSRCDFAAAGADVKDAWTLVTEAYPTMQYERACQRTF